MKRRSPPLDAAGSAPISPNRATSFKRRRTDADKNVGHPTAYLLASSSPACSAIGRSMRTRWHSRASHTFEVPQGTLGMWLLRKSRLQTSLPRGCWLWRWSGMWRAERCLCWAVDGEDGVARLLDVGGVRAWMSNVELETVEGVKGVWTSKPARLVAMTVITRSRWLGGVWLGIRQEGWRLGKKEVVGWKSLTWLVAYYSGGEVRMELLAE
ncbi:hypothetical protein GE09DRAFT_1158303 [Coniochaeta sp. 2T2.1]|nr:hypothetical protein GE09DRAFT_1158303 [Coniochaeta sp. 2T2.1]